MLYYFFFQVQVNSVEVMHKNTLETKEQNSLNDSLALNKGVFFDMLNDTLHVFKEGNFATR